MPTTQTTFPRVQHWTIDEFRVSALVYKSHRRETCRTCGAQPAVNAVWAERRSDGTIGSPADFCDQHRPATGTLPDLDYRTSSPGPAEAGQGELFPSAPRAHEYMRDPN